MLAVLDGSHMADADVSQIEDLVEFGLLVDVTGISATVVSEGYYERGIGVTDGGSWPRSHLP